jgi:hypothetical protein
MSCITKSGNGSTKAESNVRYIKTIFIIDKNVSCCDSTFGKREFELSIRKKMATVGREIAVLFVGVSLGQIALEELP